MATTQTLPTISFWHHHLFCTHSKNIVHLLPCQSYPKTSSMSILRAVQLRPLSVPFLRILWISQASRLVEFYISFEWPVNQCFLSLGPLDLKQLTFTFKCLPLFGETSLGLILFSLKRSLQSTGRGSFWPNFAQMIWICKVEKMATRVVMYHLRHGIWGDI